MSEQSARYNYLTRLFEDAGDKERGSISIDTAVDTLLDDEKYNGWANRETWLVHLWMSNEEGTYSECVALAQKQPSDAEAGAAIEAYVDSILDDVAPRGGFITDLLNAATIRVDWAEVGRAFREK